VQFDEFLGEGEADTGAFEGSAFLIVDTVEFVEDAVDFVRWDPGSGVCYCEYHVSTVFSEMTCDGNLPGKSKLERVSDDIEDDFLKLEM
jgi:hypothetical protein